MKTRYFTIADGPYFLPMAKILSERLKFLHNIDLVILTDELARLHGCIGRQYWLKTYLWDFAQDCDRIMFFDSDILPIRPLHTSTICEECCFGARLDVEHVANGQRAQCPPLFTRIKHYFNAGFFVAHRDSEPLFEQMKKKKDSRIYASCVEQTWMNKIVDESPWGLTVLPKSTFWMPKGETQFETTRMIHYAGYNKEDKLKYFVADSQKFKL